MNWVNNGQFSIIQMKGGRYLYIIRQIKKKKTKNNYWLYSSRHLGYSGGQLQEIIRLGCIFIFILCLAHELTELGICCLFYCWVLTFWAFVHVGFPFVRVGTW